jgi:hypothetical protein
VRELPLKAWLAEGRGILDFFVGLGEESEESLKQALINDLKFFECRNLISLVVAFKKEWFKKGSFEV